MGPDPAMLGRRLRQLEPLLYTLTAAILTLAVASRFYASLRLQTLYALQWSHPADFERLIAEGRGPWSAPLDDVFIHFDFARSTARGFPFQWVEGNGYSSGGTSLLYPFILAAGYWGAGVWSGFRGLALMEWAAIVASVATFGVLLGARRLAARLPRPATYLLPFGLLCIGTLDWALFSGMEVALFLGLWTAAFLASDDLRLLGNEAPLRASLVAASLLGLASGLLTATRPEGVTSAALLAVAAVAGFARRDPRRALATTALAMAPAALVLVAHGVANRMLTGESTAAGALVKLELHHPYLDPHQVFDSWLFFIKYQVLRVTQYHFADQPVYGWIAWLFAALSLAFARTRREGALLLASAALWILVIALNGQVRWQNERYTMPAVLWLLAAATLGAGALLTYAFEHRKKIRGGLVAAAATALIALFLVHQAPRFREQLWFFGRAGRNIFDQHVQAGLLLRFQLQPTPKRVLVGDAGAIPYVSDLPALDVIGLGGYHGLPFARATREHIGAAVELIERMAPDERPDTLAIYPGWWGDFPLWFGTPLERVPVRGNVICGGASKVLYRADWSSLAGSGVPFSLRAGERVLDAVDPADLVNEREHTYRVTGAPGFAGMKLLTNPADGRPLFDAGRTIPGPARETFEVSGLAPGKPLRLVVRAAPSEPTTLEVRIDGTKVGAVKVLPRNGWVEGSLDGLHALGSKARIELGPADRERVSYHVFVVGEVERAP